MSRRVLENQSNVLHEISKLIDAIAPQCVARSLTRAVLVKREVKLARVSPVIKLKLLVK